MNPLQRIIDNQSVFTHIHDLGQRDRNNGGKDDVKDQVQKTLEEMAADGTLAKISTKWFGEDITTIGK